MREYQPEIYNDHQQILNEIDELINKINGRQISLGFDYANKISGKIQNDRFFSIRDSIGLRIQSVIFHYKILDSICNPKRKLITPDLPPLGTMSIPIQQKFLFDSIIFNTISIFDYLGCMINYIMEKNKDKWEKTWSRLEHIARTNAKFNSTSLGRKILSMNNEWVGKLNEYRAELIHYQTENLASNETYNSKECSLDILVIAPSQLLKYFKQLAKITNKKDLNINSIVLWIIKTSLEIIIEIQDELKIYIDKNRIIPIGKEIITFRK
jgi:hypothetical protein